MPTPNAHRAGRAGPPPGPPPPHRTPAAHVKDHCRCPACTQANTADSRTRRRNKAYGRTALQHVLIDAAPARAHIAALRAAGIGYHTIAHHAGTSTRHLRDIAQPHPDPQDGQQSRGRINTDLAAAILAIPNELPPALTSATGTQRRIGALVALGWPLPYIARRLGRRPDSLVRTMTANRVRNVTAQAVQHLYDELAYNPPADTETSAEARVYAREHGWVSPLAWDDIDTDASPNATAIADPTRHDDAHPLDEIAIDLALNGLIPWQHLTSPEAAETIRLLADRGNSTREIAERFHTSAHSIRRQLRAGAA